MRVAWIAGQTFNVPNLLLLLGALGVGFYFYSKRGAR